MRNYRQIQVRQGSLGKYPAQAKAMGRLHGKVILVTGADSAVGCDAAIAFAREGADVALTYHTNRHNAASAKRQVEHQGGRCITWVGDPVDEEFCHDVVRNTVDVFGRLDILSNNVNVWVPQSWLEAPDHGQVAVAFHTGFSALAHMTRAVLGTVDDPDAIVNTLSVVVRRDHPAFWPLASLRSQLAHTLGIELAHATSPVIEMALPTDCEQRAGGETTAVRQTQSGEVVLSYVFTLSGDATCMTGRML